MKLVKNFLKVIVFLVLLCIVILKVGDYLKPEWNDEWINTAVVQDFYALPKNSIDVLAVGSSQLIKGYSGLELYKNYGYSSYGIGTEQQSIMNSYAFIKESLKYQSEKVVLLETKMSFEETPEPQNRKGIDNMKLSMNKINLIWNDSWQRGSFENFFSLLFPVTRFHSRWNEIVHGEEYANKPNYPNYMGYSLTGEISGDTTFENLDETITGRAPYFKNNEKYIQKIIDYCKKKDIKLIFYKNPDKDWDMQRYNTIKDIADKNEVPYIDFNLKKYSDEIGFVYSSDSQTLNHLNIYGAEKVMNYLGKYISDNCDVEITDKRNDEKYAFLKEKYEEYARDVLNKKIPNMFAVGEYLEALSSKDLTLCITKNSGFNGVLSEDSKRQIRNLGINLPLLESSKNYCAVIESGNVLYEEGSSEKIEKEMNLENVHNVKLIAGELPEIYFDKMDVSKRHPGVNIFIYNNKNKVIVETGFIDFENGHLMCGR